MEEVEHGSAEQANRRLTIEDLAAAWIAAQWVECLGDVFGTEDVLQVQREADVLSERFGIDPRAVEAAANRSSCPAAAPHLPAMAGEFRRFGDVFLSYSTHEPCEATSRRFLPKIRQAERALTALYLEWLIEILRELFPDKARDSVPLAEFLSHFGGDRLHLDIVKRGKVPIEPSEGLR